MLEKMCFKRNMKSNESCIRESAFFLMYTTSWGSTTL